MYSKLTESLRSLYLEDPRPWLVGFSGGKDSTLVAALIFEVAASIPVEQRTKQISVLCTDTCVEIPVMEAGPTDMRLDHYQGKRILLPADGSLWPSPGSLAWHRRTHGY